MFIKFGVKRHTGGVGSGKLTLIACSTTSENRVTISFEESDPSNFKEGVLELSNDQILNITFLLDGDFKENQTHVIPVDEIEWGHPYKFNPSSMTNVEVVAQLTMLERVPSNWIESSVALVLEEERPWYFRAEDVYAAIKSALQSIQTPKNVPSFDKVCNIVDHLAVQASKNLLMINIDEGFSLVTKIDDALETVFTKADSSVDSGRFQLAWSLHKLRKAVTAIIQRLTALLTEGQVQVRSRIQDLQVKQQILLGYLADSIDWAATQATATAAWVDRERVELQHQVEGYRANGEDTINAYRHALINTSLSILHYASEQVTHRIQSVRDTVTHLPVVAHPYVCQAVDVTQPFVRPVVATATPIINSIATNPLVEHIIVDTKDVIEKHERVNNMVCNASHMLEEVTAYCTDHDYYLHHKEVEEDNRVPYTAREEEEEKSAQVAAH